jgi:putative ubiquitin-RnfH superfamily antitoxin RatB of RatAB toxin-antitoxin module
MHIGVAYADKFKQTWLKLDVPDGSTAREAIERSGLLSQFPEIDLAENQIGIFGRIVKLDTRLSDGDRVEIYRPITAESMDALNRFFEKVHFYHEALTEARRRKFWDQAVAEDDDRGNREGVQARYSELLDKDCKVTLNLMCHSMGNYVLKYALQPSAAAAGRLIFDNVSLVAADANNDAHETWVERIQVRNRLYVMINENDFALAWSRRKPGQAQRVRLGHYLANLMARNARYLDVTGAHGVDNAHGYFAGKPVEQNAR